MKIEVKLFAIFRQGRFKTQEMDFPSGTCPSDVLKQLQIPEAHVGILLVNGQGPPPGYTLSPGDVMSIFPAVGGG